MTHPMPITHNLPDGSSPITRNLVFYAGYEDSPTCGHCGNHTALEGFISLEDDNTVSLTLPSAVAQFSRTMCVGCGSVYQESLDHEEAVPGPNPYYFDDHRYIEYAPFNGLGRYIETLTEEVKKAKVTEQDG